MSKGINLEEFRTQLESDATRRNEIQAKTISEQSDIIKELRKQLFATNEQLEQTALKCKKHCRGLMCMFCELKQRCSAYENPFTNKTRSDADIVLRKTANYR